MDILEILKSSPTIMTEEERKFYYAYLAENLPFKIGDIVYINTLADSLSDLYSTNDTLKKIKDLEFRIDYYNNSNLIDYFMYNKKNVWIFHIHSDTHPIYNNFYRTSELLPIIDSNIIRF